MSALGVWISGLLDNERIHFRCSRCPVCGPLLRQSQETNAQFLALVLSRPIAAPLPPRPPHSCTQGGPVHRCLWILPPSRGAERRMRRARNCILRALSSPWEGLCFRKLFLFTNLSLTEQLLPGQADSSLCSVRTCSVTLGLSLSLCLPQQPWGPCSVPSRLATSSRRLSEPCSEAFPSQRSHNYTHPIASHGRSQTQDP